MKDTEHDEKSKSGSSENREAKKKKRTRPQRKTQGQIIQEALGLGPTDIQDVEKKLFIVRFLDYFSEETLDFIFKDSTLNQYTKQITTNIDDFSTGREEDRILKQSFDSKEIIDILNKLKNKAEELALSKGIKNSMDKRLRKLTLIITLPLFAVIFGLAFIPNLPIFVLFPVLCVFCLVPQLIRSNVVKKWFAFKEQNKHEIYTNNREDVMILKNFAGELLDNIRSRLIELEVPLQLIKFVLHSRDYENLILINQKNVRGAMQYFYTFDYPADVEPFPIPESLQQYQRPLIPEKKQAEKPEKNFIVLSEMKGKEGVINYFVPTLKDKLADKINDMLNNSDFSKASKDFKEIIPNYSEEMAIYCVCGDIAEINTVQVCNWKDQFKFYLFEGKQCNCGEAVYALSLMDESDEIPEELKEIFLK
ncbi:MAG: hypothetical protein ACFFDY_13620 [Candidatus Thorarchaeota archaeon]